jgi:hypothetical protein
MKRSLELAGLTARTVHVVSSIPPLQDAAAPSPASAQPAAAASLKENPPLQGS